MTQRLLAAALTLAALANAQTAPVDQTVTLDEAIQEALAKNLDLAAVAGQTLNILGATYAPNTPLGPNQLNVHTDFPFERGHKREERVAVAREEKSLAEVGVREVMRPGDPERAERLCRRAASQGEFEAGTGESEKPGGRGHHQRNSVGVYFSMPLRIFNKNQGEIARAQREIDLAGARAVAREKSIQTEVERAYRQYTVSKQLLASVESEMLSKARSVRDTAEYSYGAAKPAWLNFSMRSALSTTPPRRSTKRAPTTRAACT